MEGRSLTQALWTDIAGLFDAIVAHPFLRGLAAGDLPEQTFHYYVVQDALYLQTFARALSTLGGKAPSQDDTEFFATRTARVISVERNLHHDLLARLGLSSEDVSRAELSPTGLAYTSYISGRVHGAPFATGLASVLPCFWIYREVAGQLARHGSPHPIYQRWISSYESPEFQSGVDAVVALMDRAGSRLGGPERDSVRLTFRTASRYEWMFWDAAWRREAWPIEPSGAQPAH
ncbi:MAG: thiaminase II [Thermoleophilia bacterium]|nr:thiaminase II [Thermoleophilia bacterium]